MPIRGLSEQGRIPRIGKIHLGVKVQSEKNPNVWYPKATPYFVLTDAPYVREVYPDKPIELRIMFPAESDEKIASQYYRAYKQITGLVCKGDGYKATARVDSAKWRGKVELGIWANSESKETQMVEIPCAGVGYDGCPPCPAYENKDCKRIMMLQFFVLGCRRFGIHQLDTSSVNSILNINGMLDVMRNNRVLGGNVSGVKLLLTLVPQEVISPDDSKRKTVYVLQLTAEEDVEELRRLTAQTAVPAMPEGRGEETPQVVEGDVIEPDEEKAGEFFGDPSELPPEEPAGNPPPPAQRPTLRGVEERPDITGTPKTRPRQAGLGEARRTPAPWMEDWTTLFRAAEGMGFTQEQVLRFLEIAEPTDFAGLKTTAQACLNRLEAAKKWAGDHNMTPEEAIEKLVAARHNNKQPA